MWIWGNVFGYLKWRDCDRQCDHQCWVKGEVYKIRSPFRNSEGKIENKEFKTADEFWNWFFTSSAADPASDLFDDFRLAGCWNWLIDDKLAEKFNDILSRLTASKELGISATGKCYDDSPANLVEQLLYANSELNKAQIRWQKSKNII